MAPLKQLKWYVECAVGHRLSGTDFNDSDPMNEFPTVEDRRNAAKAIAANVVELRKSASTRAISDRGSNIVAVGLQTGELRTITQVVTSKCLDPEPKPDIVSSAVYQLVFGRKPQFTISEVTRKSRIEADFNVLLGLASKFLPVGAPRAAPLPLRCERRGPPFTITYESKSEATAWATGHAIPLAVKRATVTLAAALPAVVPQLLAATDMAGAKELIKNADEFLHLKILREQEAEDLKLFNACPVRDPGRLDALQQIVCALDNRTTTTNSTSLAAVEALSKMATPRRTTFLRWAAEHKTGEARDKALVALGQIAPATSPEAPAGKEIKQSSQFLSGPLEHWSIGADVFVTRETVFKKSDDGALVLDGTPPVFYVSLNFLLGDLPSTERTILQNVELKWLVQGSKSPFDSLGFGIGLRGSHLKRFGVDFDLISPFAALTWTVREERSQPRVRQIRVGVSLNINKALEWVK